MAIAIIQLDIYGEVVSKLASKHAVTEDEVRAHLQWPARVPMAFDDDPEHGPRWLALVTVAAGLQFFAALLPVPEWEEERATRWELKTAYWL